MRAFKARCSQAQQSWIWLGVWLMSSQSLASLIFGKVSWVMARWDHMEGRRELPLSVLIITMACFPSCLVLSLEVETEQTGYRRTLLSHRWLPCFFLNRGREIPSGKRLMGDIVSPRQHAVGLSLEEGVQGHQQGPGFDHLHRQP